MSFRRDPTTRLSSARVALWEFLGQAQEPVKVGEVAAACGQHPNTVREHLEALVEAGLVDRILHRQGVRGRPPVYYRARPAEAVRPQLREYSCLALVLAEQLTAASADPSEAAIAAGLAWGKHLTASATPADQPRRDARALVTDLLDRLGFDPQEADFPQVRLRQCPLLEVARRHPQIICNVHLGLMRGAYHACGQDPGKVTLTPFAGDNVCLVRLS